MPEVIIEYVKGLDQELVIGGKNCYYNKRDIYNKMILEEEYNAMTAGLFLFLNKHCFNGLYRVNQKGVFNVPYNNTNGPTLNKENIYEVYKYLKKVTILEGDFEEASQSAEEGDFIFFDSPYAPLNSTSFTSYTKEGFTKEDHERLAELFLKLNKKGCYCMLTNHNTGFIRELYKDFEIDIVSVKRMINSDAKKRIGEEVIIYNY